MAVEVVREVEHVRLRVSGVLDLQTAPAFLAQARAVRLDGSDSVVVDLTRVSFMDSSGLLALMSAYECYGERLRITHGSTLEPVMRLAGARSFLPLDSA